MGKKALVMPILVTAMVGSATLATQPAGGAATDPSRAVAVRAGSPVPGGWRPVVTGDTSWTPTITAFEVGGGACGAGIVGGFPKDGDLGTRQKRIISYQNGDVVTLFRGSVTLSVGLENDGWTSSPDPEPKADLPVSGPVTRVDYASGATLVDRGTGGLVAVNTSEDAAGPEQAAFVKAGLTSFYLLRRGALTEYVGPDADLARLVRKPTALVNICDLIGHDGDRNHTVLIYTSEGIGEPIYR